MPTTFLVVSADTSLYGLPTALYAARLSRPSGPCQLVTVLKYGSGTPVVLRHWRLCVWRPQSAVAFLPFREGEFDNRQERPAWS